MNSEFIRAELNKQMVNNIQVSYNLEEYRKAVREYFDNISTAKSYGDVLRATNELKVSIDAIEAVITVQKFY